MRDKRQDAIVELVPKDVSCIRKGAQYWARACQARTLGVPVPDGHKGARYTPNHLAFGAREPLGHVRPHHRRDEVPRDVVIARTTGLTANPAPTIANGIR